MVNENDQGNTGFNPILGTDNTPNTNDSSIPVPKPEELSPISQVPEQQNEPPLTKPPINQVSPFPVPGQTTEPTRYTDYAITAEKKDRNTKAVITVFVVIAIVLVTVVSSLFITSVSNTRDAKYGSSDKTFSKPDGLLALAEELGYKDKIATPGSTYDIGEEFYIPFYSEKNGKAIIKYKVTEIFTLTDQQETYVEEYDPKVTYQGLKVEWQVVAGELNEYVTPKGVFQTYGNPGEQTKYVHMNMDLEQDFCNADEWFDPETPDLTYTACQVNVSATGLTGIEFGQYDTDYDPTDSKGVRVNIPHDQGSTDSTEQPTEADI